MERDSTTAPSASDRVVHPIDILLRHRPEYAQFLKAGDMVDGTVVVKKGSRLYLDLGSRGLGVVFGREFYAAADVIKRFSPGERVSAKVLDPDNDEGCVELSLREAGRERNWREFSRLAASGDILRLRVLDANRGGLILGHLGTQGFLPASQLSQEHYPRVEGGDKERIYEELKKLVGQELEVSVIDVDPHEGKLIFSEKTREAAVVRERLAAYHAGDVIEGEVSGLVSFGAFVKFGDGLEGLVHISEIDWQLVANPGDVLKTGERVSAKIIGIEGDKVSLSLKALKPDPWAGVEDRFREGGLVTGTVVKFNPFGAFVKFDGEIQGLAHISEFGSEAKMREVLSLGEPHEFRVLAIDLKEHRLALGLVREEPEALPSVEPPAGNGTAEKQGL